LLNGNTKQFVGIKLEMLKTHAYYQSGKLTMPGLSHFLGSRAESSGLYEINGSEAVFYKSGPVVYIPMN
jgi:hypothetical protein